MNKSAKVAISLPEQVLKEIEKERKSRGESRSAFFKRAVEELLKQQQVAKAVEAYVHGYRLMPESATEVKAIQQISSDILAKESW